MNKTILGCLISLFFLSCIEPLEIEIKEDAAEILVVEGKITDQPGPYFVSLNWSQPIDSQSTFPVSQANVSIAEEGGTIEILTEQRAGLYATDSARFKGIAGKRYKVMINLENGASYESDWALLKASPPIDSIHFEYRERNTLEGLYRGLDVLVDTHDPTGESQFYRWEFEETWRYSVPFAPRLEFLGNLKFNSLNPEKEYCFQSNISNEISVGSSVNNVSDIITDQLVTYITTRTNRLIRRYTILVKQHVLEEEEYLFWKSLKESTENVGGLYDRQPQSLTGNINRIDDPTEPVLGYFSVSGVSKKRVFINPPLILPQGVAPGNFLYRSCAENLDSIPVGFSSDQLVYAEMANGKIFYSTYGTPGIQGYLMTTVQCSDCTFYGGTPEKPDFWID